MPSVLKPGQRRSQNEVNFENELISRKIKFDYEPETFTLLPARKGSMGIVAPITYTPDYLLHCEKGKKVYVEVKGYARASDLLKSKIADMYFNSKGVDYIMVGNFGTRRTGLKNFYHYYNKNRISTIENQYKSRKVDLVQNVIVRKNKAGEVVPVKKPPTFWEDLDKIVNK